MRTVYLDTETTGLSPLADELVEIAVVADDGSILLDTLLRPTRLRSWADAEKIHGISPEKVAAAPTLADISPALLDIVSGAHVVLYNAAFDWPFLPQDVRAAPILVTCAMLAYAEDVGEWNEYKQGYRWHRLTAAAQAIGYKWQAAAHRARGDALATRAVWHHLREREVVPHG